MSPRSLGSSALLHLVLVLLIAFGLPHMAPEDIPYQPQVIAIDLDLAPVANAPNRTPTPPKKPEPTPPKPPPPAPKPEPVKKPEPKPEPKPAPKPEPVKDKPKPKEPEKKPDPKKEEPKKEEPKEDEPTLEDILKGVEKATPKQEAEPAEAEQGETITSDVPYDPSLPLSQTVRDSIRNQIMKCWNYQGGAKNQSDLVAHIQVVFREDGSILDARLRSADEARYRADAAFRSLVDSARRATKNKECVPLKGLPRGDYKSWSKVELVFDPDEMW